MELSNMDSNGDQSFAKKTKKTIEQNAQR
ncbi:hypothetical protein TorRG33x02_149910 [Trema orientale]|uniref:Uncharacterized protein n=1 Tax=Trema orientale TaxID=63057 RepID=A0A2P5EUB1_TREOI|nr:hypothetical protein TorRG33x02_149910 [Trema orientale]